MRGTIQRDKHYVYGTCETCREENVLVYENADKLLCAEHTRQYIHNNPTKQGCDRCNADKNVFRDPSHRRNEYLCLECHRADGFVPNNTVVYRAMKDALTKDQA
jgi:hypothetical protein